MPRFKRRFLEMDVQTYRREEREAGFQRWVEETADLKGWLLYHAHLPQRDRKGFPDLILLRRGRMIVAELKREGEQPRPEQLVWLAEFRLVPGPEVYLWFPHDREEIVRILT